MSRNGVLLVAVLLSSMAATVFAEAVPVPPGEIHGTVGVTYDTKYVWRGITVYGSKSAIHPFVDLDLFESGFHVETIGHRANAGGFENGERWDYALYYAGAVNAEQSCETRYMVGYRYFNNPQLTSHRAYKSATDIGSADLQELFAGVSFPKLLGVQGLVPGYVLLKTWPSNSGTSVGSANSSGGTYAGWAHVFMLDYGVSMNDICPDMPAQMLNLHAETVYNDGVDPRPNGGYTDSDFTHVMFGVSTDFDLGGSMTLTPGVNYQITFEDDEQSGVSPDHDIVWASLTLKYKF